MRSSALDAYLAIGLMVDGRFAEIGADDDSGGGTDAQLDLTLPEAGVYTIRTNSLLPGRTGTYTLEVARLP